jgi:hypothetical protein
VFHDAGRSTAYAVEFGQDFWTICAWEGSGVCEIEKALSTFGGATNAQSEIVA